jgi:surface carbohydrate biosynthesis protein (TIGR04326 family)
MLELLNRSIDMLPNNLCFTIKPHPASMGFDENFPRLSLKIVTDPLGEIMKNYDIAYCANNTSAAVDAYLAGLPVVVMLNDNELNMSPLMGYPGVNFVGTPPELARAFTVTRKNEGGVCSLRDFFFLDPKLPRWKTLLGL